MDSTDEDEDLKLVKASASLLTELERDLPRLLWKTPGHARSVHRSVKHRDLSRVIALIEPFQGDPQLLDANLKCLIPPIVEAYLCALALPPREPKPGHIDLENALCNLLYTLCKVRGYKVVVGFFNNEPRYLEPILEALERNLASETLETSWQVLCILLLWLTHLLLTPFDLISISNKQIPSEIQSKYAHLPPLVSLILRVGISQLYAATKAQDAAAAMLCRLCKRPDVKKLQLADALTDELLESLENQGNDHTASIHDLLGSLRFVSAVASSVELSHLTPKIFQACMKAFGQDAATVASSNAVAKKLAIKTLRNIALLSLGSAGTHGPLLSFLQTHSILEDTIDHLLQSLSDKDTPVRFAAAKAISLIVAALDPEMGQEVIQAILDTFKEDMPTSAVAVDFTTANALKWHGLTLALAQSLFKRSASPEQLPDILDALIMALQFQQRTATKTLLGANVRDAANFGIWSLARRYTTAELMSVKTPRLQTRGSLAHETSIIQLVAVQLLLSACLDPAGNIRRGSSAALQELVGRHPDQVHEGIALVQVVDYLAVGLRARAMIDVALRSAALHEMYWTAILDGLLGWRGIMSADVISRESAGTSIARLSVSRGLSHGKEVLATVAARLQTCLPAEYEELHGYTHALAETVHEQLQRSEYKLEVLAPQLAHLFALLERFPQPLGNFSARVLKSEIPGASARLMTALCAAVLSIFDSEPSLLQIKPESLHCMDDLTEKIFGRHEDWILAAIPALAQNFFHLKRQMEAPLACIGLKSLTTKLKMDGAKSTLHGAGSAIALGALLPLYNPTGVPDESTGMAMKTLTSRMSAMNVDWRVVSARALQLVVGNIKISQQVSDEVVDTICAAVHRGMNDYTIDERGDVGSLVRLQSIKCASMILQHEFLGNATDAVQVLESDICRLSLEKLDKVRLQAAICRQSFFPSEFPVSDIKSVSTGSYFEESLRPLASDASEWLQMALLEGCISCAGIGNEALLSAARQALATQLSTIDNSKLESFMGMFNVILKAVLTENLNSHPALELLAFLLDMQIPQRLNGSTTYKWVSLLSLVQKSHHKSNDMAKIIAAVHVYRGLAENHVLRHEVLKKLASMLRTNPYPRVRMSVAETLWMITSDAELRDKDWSRPVAQFGDLMQRLQAKYAGSAGPDRLSSGGTEGRPNHTKCP